MPIGDATTYTLTAGHQSGGSLATSSEKASQSIAAPDNRSLVRLQWAVGLTLASLVLLAAVRLSYISGLVMPVTIDGPSMAPALLGARYELACSECQFDFSRDASIDDGNTRAVCPNCGYRGNRLSAAQLRSGERVLIDRWPHIWGRLQRGEIVAARLPEAPSELIVKRIAAVGPARLAIRDGDLYVNDAVVWRPIQELREVRQLVHDNSYQPPASAELPPRWQPVASPSAWRAVGTGFKAAAADSRGKDFDWLQYHHWMCMAVPAARSQATAVRDYDPYNVSGERELNEVRDLVLTSRVKARGDGRFALAVLDGNDRFEAVFQPGRRVLVLRDGAELASVDFRLSFSRRPVAIEFGLCDQQVLLLVSGRTLVRKAYERHEAPHRDVLYPLAIGSEGLDIEVNDLRVWRDIYYLEPLKTPRDWEPQQPLAAGQYLLLGDNQPASLDGRTWGGGVPRASILGRVYRPFWQQR